MNCEQMIDYYRDRATRCLKFAEGASDPRDAAAFKSAARAWETLARDPVQWSYEGDRLRLAELKTFAAQQLDPCALAAQELQHQIEPPQRQIEPAPRVPVATIAF